ncbi:MAG: hypothetical protein F4W95_00405 [Chloroflexi bacterium]|nr:hypothetical protein [Chloroflexota bacterium]MYD46928.1 hypothetical protein [Chloroflexota bacterium]
MLRSLGRIAYRSYVVVLIGSVALTAMLTLVRPATTAIHTAAFAAQVLPGPVKVQPWLAPEPERVKTTYRRDDGTDAEADIYVIPDDKQRAGLLIFLGANAAGADDPDVINLGQALARAGFAVMYYWSPTMGERAEVDVGEIPNIVAGFEHLQRQEYVDRQRVGLAGFSVGASFALAAAADPRIADDIAFVNAFGGYHDAADLLAQIAAGRAVEGGAETPWEVDKLTRRVFENMLTPEADSEAAQGLLAGVGSVAEARELYEQLPDAFRADVDAISPSKYVEQWSGDTVMRVMHDRGDPLIPVGESRRLVAALQEQRPDVATYYTETDIFRHVRPDAETDWQSMLRGAWQLYRHMYHIVAVARQP